MTTKKITAVFMTPPVTLEERYGPLATSGNCVPCLASLILAALARSKGYGAHVIDCAAEGLTQAEAMERLEGLEPDLVGFTTTTLTTLPAERLARAVKVRFPRARVVVGGPHATAVPEETLERCASFDAAALHEGEETLLDLLEALEHGESDFTRVAGLACRDAEGMIRRTPPRTYFRELDTLPFPAWDLLNEFPDRYTPGFFKVRQMPSTSFVSSRGCPFECSFCDTAVFGQKIRSHSAAYMADLFEYLNRQFGIRDVTFEDDTFMVYRRNVEAFCRELQQRNLRMTWACNSRVSLAHPDLLQSMKAAGCWHISYGIESGSQEILDHESKKITLKQIEEGIRNTAEAGIAAKGFFIVGHARETQETLQATYELTRCLPFADLSVTCMTPFPGSPLSKNAHEFGEFQDDWTQMNLLNPVFIPHGLTAADLRYWQRKILRDFYFRPRTLISYAGRVLRHPSPRYILGVARSAGALVRHVFSRKPASPAGIDASTGVCS